MTDVQVSQLLAQDSRRRGWRTDGELTRYVLTFVSCPVCSGEAFFDSEGNVESCCRGSL